ncbi:hypothetical protein BS78_K036900 [Paspalum vaginatum]|uniref:Tf2-1-like SH3-like domain-containing protein n=1 Tax=Paspalum vaginatum TaxID=158149 RepID=A0A9W7X9M2_9POAL|nr:hypothetical protein BS78_K036900 [Paspalum vaginatum]
MDFIEGLPRSKRFDCILVVVDKFSRYAHFIPLAHPFTALTVAHAFMDNIYKLHEFWYNTCFHTTLNQTPFQALYGHAPCHFGIVPDTACPVQDLSDWFSQRNLMNDLLRQQLSRAQIRMKRQADKGRSERQFQVGDWVFLKLQPYVQSSLAPRANQKLAFKFFGPYQILSRMGTVAYKLQLPASASIHPVFHVSQLKRAVGTGFTPSSELPNPSYEWSIPLKILGRRTLTRGADSVSQVLVQWSQMPESLATWEDTEALQQ